MNHFLRKRGVPHQITVKTVCYDSQKEHVLDNEFLYYFLMDVEIDNLTIWQEDMATKNVPDDRQKIIFQKMYELFCEKVDFSDIENAEDMAEHIMIETEYDSTILIDIEINDEHGYTHVLSQDSQLLLPEELRYWLLEMLYYYPEWDVEMGFPVRCNVMQVNCDKWLHWINQTTQEEQYQTITMLNQLGIGLEKFLDEGCHITNEVSLNF